MLLFLDFDGVLHPDAVFRRANGTIELRAPGQLFMWAPYLSEILAEAPDCRIVLSTSWVRLLGYRAARQALPEELQGKVLGATWHSHMSRAWPIPWDSQSRFEQIAAYLSRIGNCSNWLAVDDDSAGWPPGQSHRLVRTDPSKGLSAPDTIAELKERLLRPC